LKEPAGLSRDDGKRPDGVTLCPGQKANYWRGMSQYQTPICRFPLADTATTAGAAAVKATSNKEAKYSNYQTVISSFQLPQSQPGLGTTKQWN